MLLLSKDAMINLGNDKKKYFPARVQSAGLLNSSQQHDNYRILFVPFKQFVDTCGNLLKCAHRTSTSHPLPVLNT
jgi:hypothetical protein